MILSIAWKNIWRNKLRSMVVILAIGFGLLSGVFSVGLMNGMIEQRLDAGINIEVASIQLHNSKYMENSESQFTIKNTDQLMQEIAINEDVKAVSKRYKMECMISSNRAATGLSIVGIEPDNDKTVSELYKYISDSNGVFLSDKGRNPIIISSRTAEKLKVKIRNKVIVNGVKKDGTTTKGSFRIVGIFKTSNSMYDQANAFIRYSDMARIFDFDKNEAHEIIILNKIGPETDVLQETLKSKYTIYTINEQALLRARNDSIPENIYNILSKQSPSKSMTKDEYSEFLSGLLGKEDLKNYKNNLFEIAEGGINVMTWSESSPDLAMMSSWIDLMLFMLVGIILLALGFGIVNTMLMVVLERTKELGMLMAIGMNRRKVFKMILLETVLLSLTGGVFGILLGSGLIEYFQQVGLDISAYGEGMEGMGYNSIIYPSVSFISYIQISIMVIFTGIFASIYPARQATKLNPADAVRSE